MQIFKTMESNKILMSIFELFDGIIYAQRNKSFLCVVEHFSKEKNI